jgi:hypothetical protein
MDEMKKIGAQMANVMFNLAQLPGERITYQQAETFDKLRKEWDAAVRAPSSAPTAGRKSIDSPEFRKLIAHAQGFDDGEPIFGESELALIAHIDTWAGRSAENMVVEKQPEIGAKTAETRMDSGFAGGGRVAHSAAPATDADAADLAAALNAAVDAEFPIPDTPHTSVLMRNTEQRAAMWRGINAARKILGARSAGDAVPAEMSIAKIRESIFDYYRALNRRDHGAVAMDRAFRAIECELGMGWYLWNRAEEAAKAEPDTTPTPDDAAPTKGNSKNG